MLHRMLFRLACLCCLALPACAPISTPGRSATFTPAPQPTQLPTPTAAPPAETPTPAAPALPLLAGGAGHTCLAPLSGGLSCWGHNTFGQLGVEPDPAGTMGRPVQARQVAGPVTRLAAGYYQTCFVSDGALWCLGQNNAGQLGDGTTQDSSLPVRVQGLEGEVTALAAGAMSTCAALREGGVWCWGRNSSGQLGDGTTQDSPTPVAVTGLSGPVRALAAGVEFACALLEDGRVVCWGSNSSGQLGDGTFENRSTPVPVTGLPGGITALAARGYNACVLTGTGGVWCWGMGEDPGDLVPVPVPGLESGVAAVSVGNGFACALDETGEVRCWGDNYFGQLGDVNLPNTGWLAMGNPVDVPGVGRGALTIVSGEFHTCALMNTGAVTCWGDPSSFQLGDGSIRWK